MNSLHFQYCPKLAVFDKSGERILLCQRQGEADYDRVFSLIGGKMEHKDASIVDALKREKDEEVGQAFAVKVLPHYSVDVLFTKKDGNRMILPHFYAEHLIGEISLSDEYSAFQWVELRDLGTFAPMIENLRWIVPLLHRVGSAASQNEFAVL